MILGGILSGLWTGFLDAVITGLNALISAFASTVQGGFDLLPEMPTLPVLPTTVTNVYGWVAWVFPVSTVEDIIAWATTMWVLWFVVSIGLRWAKAERGAG